jgi:hypothetical protein
MTRVSRDERIRLRALANPAGPSLMRDLLDDYDDAVARILELENAEYATNLRTLGPLWTSRLK